MRGSGIPWADLTVGVAAIVGLVLVATTMHRTIKDLLTFLHNHVSDLTEAQTQVATALTKVVMRLEGLEDKLDEHTAMDRVDRPVRGSRSRRTKI